MQMWTARQAGISRPGDKLAAFHVLSVTHQNLGGVSVDGAIRIAVIQFYHDTVPAGPSSEFNGAIGRCIDRRSDIVGNIKAFMRPINIQDGMEPNTDPEPAVISSHWSDRRKVTKTRSVFFLPFCHFPVTDALQLEFPLRYCPP